jgi:predicted DNA-binding transcriptional regulator AlpA
MERAMEKRFLPDAKVRQRYGVAACTVWRWDNDPESRFPKPVYMNGRKYRDIAELDAFDALLAAERAARFSTTEQQVVTDAIIEPVGAQA